MSEPTEEEKRRTVIERVIQLWDRSKITIMGVSTLVAILTTTWALSGSQAEIKAQITSVAATVDRLEISHATLGGKQEVTTAVVAKHDTRLAEYGVAIGTVIKEQALAGERLSFIEKLLMSGNTPKVEVRP